MLTRQVLYHLSHSAIQSFFALGSFDIGSHLFFFSPGWPQTEILLISTSQVARVTGVSHQCLTL
jgi:hypothetical protein